MIDRLQSPPADDNCSILMVGTPKPSVIFAGKILIARGRPLAQISIQPAIGQ
jgi:hypothetical protein